MKTESFDVFFYCLLCYLFKIIYSLTTENCKLVFVVAKKCCAVYFLSCLKFVSF